MPTKFIPIRPKQFNSKAITKAIKRRADNVSKTMESDFLSGVKDWKHKVNFNVEVTLHGSGVSISIYTNDEVYKFVHDGTKAHEIVAKTPGGKLRFQGTYTAKTIPGTIQSRSGGSSGNYQYRVSVNHPGFEGRFFSKLIFKKWTPRFKREMELAIKEGARETGHSI